MLGAPSEAAVGSAMLSVTIAPLAGAALPRNTEACATVTPCCATAGLSAKSARRGGFPRVFRTTLTSLASPNNGAIAGLGRYVYRRHADNRGDLRPRTRDFGCDHRIGSNERPRSPQTERPANVLADKRAQLEFVACQSAHR